MANKNGKAVKVRNPNKQVPVTFGAYPDDLDRWKEAARLDNRNLSQWIRLRLLKVEKTEHGVVVDVGAGKGVQS